MYPDQLYIDYTGTHRIDHQNNNASQSITVESNANLEMHTSNFYGSVVLNNGFIDTWDKCVFFNGLINKGWLWIETGLTVVHGTFSSTNDLELNGGSLDLRDATVSGFSNGVLSSPGIWYLWSGKATVYLSGRPITTLKTSVSMYGPSTNIFVTSVDGSTKTAINQSLSQIGAGGSLDLENGHNFASTSSTGLRILNGGILNFFQGTLSAKSFNIDAGGRVQFYGTLKAPVTNNGFIGTDSALISGQLGGSGTTQLSVGATLELAGQVKNTQHVLFGGNSGDGPETLLLDAAAGFGASIGGFGSNRTIGLKGFDATSARIAYTGSQTGGTLGVIAGASRAKLVFSGNYSISSFHLESDGHGGTNITYIPPGMAQLASAIAGEPHVGSSSSFATYEPPHETPSLAAAHGS